VSWKGKAGVRIGGHQQERERSREDELSELGLIVLEIREELAHFAQCSRHWQECVVLLLS